MLSINLPTFRRIALSVCAKDGGSVSLCDVGTLQEYTASQYEIRKLFLDFAVRT